MTDATPAIDPRRTALLLMDYQHGIIGRLPDPEALLATAVQAIKVVRDHGGTVGYVRVAFQPADVDAIPATSAMARVKGMGAAMHDDSPGTAIHDAVAPQDGDIIVRKVRVGAFSTTDLDRQLRDRDIDTLILAGISTSGVLLSTVRDAADKDYRILVLSDASADPQPDVHEFLTTRVFPRQAQVIATDELDELLAG
jgi:nicotinamidase-related amidase